MSDAESDSSDSSFKQNYLHPIHYLTFLLGLTFFSENVSAQQQLDTTKAQTFYMEVIHETECGGFGDGLSQTEFYLLLTMYFGRDTRQSYNPQYSPKRNEENPYTAQSDRYAKEETRTPDTVVQLVYIHDTIMQAAIPDTVFIGAGMPTADDVAISQEVLKKIIQDKEFSELIRGTVSEMSSDELNKFKKEMNQEFLQMKNELALEQARRKVAELEAKKEEQLARQEKHKEQKEKWKVLSKEERKELIKARAVVLAYGAAATVGAAGAAVVGVGAILGSGILAIGKGLIRVPVAIWNWLDNHFYIKIDLSCSTQRRIKAYRLAHNYKSKSVKKYKGHCPGW